MEAAKEKLRSLNTPKTYIHTAISLAIMIIFRLLPAPAPMTELGMQIVGIFFAMIYAWIFLDITWSTLFYLCMLGATTEYGTVVSVVRDGFGHNGVYLAFFVMIFTSLFNASGTSKYLAARIVSSKLGRGRPYMLLLLIAVASFVVGAVVEPVPATIILWSIIYSMSEVIGYKPGEPWPLIACMVTWFGVERAFNLLPFRSASQGAVALYETLSGSTMVFIKYFFWALVVSALGIAILFLVIRFILKPDMSKIREMKGQVSMAEKATPYQKFVLIATGLMIVAQIIPTILPASWFITKIFSSLGYHGIVIIAIAIVLFLNFNGAVTFDQMMSAVLWKVLFIMAGGLALATAMMSEGAGVIPFLTMILTPLFRDMGEFAFILVLFLIIAVLTQFCNSLAVLTAFTPIAYSLAEGTGMLNHSYMGPLICMVVIFASSLAILTPSGCAASALLHGNREWIPQGKLRTFFLIGLPVIGFISCGILGYPLGILLLS